MGKNQWHIVVFKAYMIAAFSFIFGAFILSGCMVTKVYKCENCDKCKPPIEQIPDWLKCKKGGSHESSGIVLLTFPEIYTCVKCCERYSKPINLINEFEIQKDSINLKPLGVGYLLIDTTNGKIYKSKDTSSHLKIGSAQIHNTIIETGGYKINLSYSPDTLVIK